MSWLWINPSFGPELSMLQIANICGEILLRLWRERSEMDVDRVFATVCLVGWCPKQETARAFLLSPRVDTDGTSISLNEVEASAGPHYFGSGAKAARDLSADRPKLTPPQVIREVVHRQLDDAVGGRVQYGRMSGTDFRVFAVYDFDVHEQDKTLTTGYYIGGMELLAEDEKLNLPEGFLLLPNHAVTPFLDEQNDFIERGYTPVTNYAHFPALIGRPRTRP